MKLIFRRFRFILFSLLFFIAVSVPAPKNQPCNEDFFIQLPDAVLVVTMLYVPETEACRPDGYQSYSSTRPSNCIKLSIEDINNWIEDGRQKIEFGIPPSEISLGQDFIELLDSYESFSKDDASTRRSMVLVFDWQEPQNLSISLKRKNPNISNNGIIDMEWHGTLNNERRWIHHERADAYLPANNIKWTLTAGEQVWSFKTRR